MTISSEKKHGQSNSAIEREGKHFSPLIVGLFLTFGGIIIIFIASVIALIFVAPSIIKKTRKMSSQIPFGPFIIIATLIYVHFIEQIKLLLSI